MLPYVVVFYFVFDVVTVDEEVVVVAAAVAVVFLLFMFLLLKCSSICGFVISSVVSVPNMVVAFMTTVFNDSCSRLIISSVLHRTIHAEENRK